MLEQRMCLNARWPLNRMCYYNIRHYEKTGVTRWKKLWDCDDIRKYPVDCAALNDGRVVVIGHRTKDYDIKLYAPDGQVIWRYIVHDHAARAIQEVDGEVWHLRTVATRTDNRIVVFFERTLFHGVLAVEIDPDPEPVVTRWASSNMSFLYYHGRHLGDAVSLRDGTVAVAMNRGTGTMLIEWRPEEEDLHHINITSSTGLVFESNDVAFDPAEVPTFFIWQHPYMPSGGSGLIRFPYPRRAGEPPGDPLWERGWPPLWSTRSWDVSETGLIIVSGEIDVGSPPPWPTIGVLSVDTGDLLYTLNTTRPKGVVRICHGAGDEDIITRGLGSIEGPERWSLDGSFHWRHQHMLNFQPQCAVNRLDGSVTFCSQSIAATRWEASFVGPDD